MPFHLFVLWFVVLLDGVSVFWGPLHTQVRLGSDTLIMFKINITGRRVRVVGRSVDYDEDSPFILPALPLS